MKNTIKAVVNIIHSKHDKYGNTYFAFVYTDCATGKEVKGLIDTNNFNSEIFANVKKIETILPIREYNHKTKNWPYAGCGAAEIKAFINKQLAQSI